MKRFLLTATVLTVALGGVAAAQPLMPSGKDAQASFVGAKYARMAKITMPEAIAIALKAHPGKITDRELEKERGGSGLRYSFDVKSNGQTAEVGVDAKTGRVLENKMEGPHPD